MPRLEFTTFEKELSEEGIIQQLDSFTWQTGDFEAAKQAANDRKHIFIVIRGLKTINQVQTPYVVCHRLSSKDSLSWNFLGEFRLSSSSLLQQTTTTASDTDINSNTNVVTSPTSNTSSSVPSSSSVGTSSTSTGSTGSPSKDTKNNSNDNANSTSSTLNSPAVGKNTGNKGQMTPPPQSPVGGSASSYVPPSGGTTFLGAQARATYTFHSFDASNQDNLTALKTNLFTGNFDSSKGFSSFKDAVVGTTTISNRVIAAASQPVSVSNARVVGNIWVIQYDASIVTAYKRGTDNWQEVSSQLIQVHNIQATLTSALNQLEAVNKTFLKTNSEKQVQNSHLVFRAIGKAQSEIKNLQGHLPALDAKLKQLYFYDGATADTKQQGIVVAGNLQSIVDFLNQENLKQLQNCTSVDALQAQLKEMLTKLHEKEKAVRIAPGMGGMALRLVGTVLATVVFALVALTLAMAIVALLANPVTAFATVVGGLTAAFKGALAGSFTLGAVEAISLGSGAGTGLLAGVGLSLKNWGINAEIRRVTQVNEAVLEAVAKCKEAELTATVTPLSPS